MSSKEIFIFPYINTEKVIKMDDFEIHPLEKYNLEEELNGEEILILNEFTNSFRKSLFHEGKSPEKVEGIGILKYKGTILRTNENSNDINDKVKIIFLFLKLHISIDFFNQWMSVINIKSFDYFGFNFSNNITNKFGNMGECKSLHSTVPENIRGIKNIKFLPIKYTINNIPVSFSIVNNSDELLGIDKEVIDITNLYNGINKDVEYYKKFLNLSSIHFGLEQQNDLFFYYSIIPSILEVILYPNIDKNDIKKQKAIDYGKKLDKEIIKENEIIETLIYVKNNGTEIKDSVGVVARSIISIYDMRNNLLHEGKKSFDKMIVHFGGYKLKIYDLFQLIFKYSILNDFIEKGIISNEFVKLSFEGDIFTTGNIKITANIDKLYMDDGLNLLLEKAKSDKKLKQGLYKE